jgi:uncharacterized protein YoxC
VSTWVEISIVASAIAFIVLAVVAIRAIGRIDRATDEIVQSVRTISDAAAQAKPAIEEARQIIGKVGAMTPKFERVAERFEKIGHQIASVSENVVQEVGSPLRAAVAVVRGVRTGTNHLVSRLFQGRASTNAKGGSYDG